MTGSGVTKISARYAAALPLSHTSTTLAEVWAGNSKLLTLAIEPSSTITVDRASLVRRSCSVVLTDPNAGTAAALVPATLSSNLAPNGNELVLYSGITYTDGTTELIQLGVFGIDDVDIDDGASDLVLTLTAGDRAVAVQHAGFSDLYTIAPGTNVGTAIKAIISTRQTGLTLTYAFATTTSVTPTTPIVYNPGDDPWAKATELATAIGYELFFDAAGVCTFLAIPDPKTRAVSWSYDEGSVNIASHLRRRLSRTAVPNYIIRDGQGAGVSVPVRGVASDTNPKSATYVNGPYGTQVDYQSSALITTAAQALTVAKADLLLALGSIETMSVQALPKVDTDVDDVVEVTRARTWVSGAKYVVDGFSLGFGPGGLIDIKGRQVPPS